VKYKKVIIGKRYESILLLNAKEIRNLRLVVNVCHLNSEDDQIER